MGIPSYFSHIVRQHRSIIKKYQKETDLIDNLYLDGNSLIYEAVRELDPPTETDAIYKSVCEKIQAYIQLLSPKQKVLVAFDGVAPAAKLKQQRNRRYMAWFQQQVHQEIKTKILKQTSAATAGWNTAAITPGTLFMQRLGEYIKKYFYLLDDEEGGNKLKIIISAADEAGEGEHKIYEYIRSNPAYHAQTQTVIYGLDADLIMLTLNHLHLSQKMYLFRETPEFIKSVDNTLNPNELYFLDIPAFGQILEKELGPSPTKNADGDTRPRSKPSTPTMHGDTPSAPTMHGDTPSTPTMNGANGLRCGRVSQRAVGADGVSPSPCTDYIFLCFFLGNDFLPHFPSLNIRTSGIDRLLSAYKYLQEKQPDFALTFSSEDGQGKITIIWKNVRQLLEYLAKNENYFLKTEYVLREKQSKRLQYGRPIADAIKKEEDAFLSLPLKERENELYIQPNEPGWEERYYWTLFGIKIDDTLRKEICLNYLEGLEWTLYYYTTGCIDWRWTYKYAYPPLLADLLKYTPYFNIRLLTPQPKQPVHPLVQLSYVLPQPSQYLLPAAVQAKLAPYLSQWYKTDYTFQWAFCKFFWEAHAELPLIDLSELEKLVINN